MPDKYPSRIIRYTTLPEGMLSRLDRQRNILEIDKDAREYLTQSSRDRLDCSDADWTHLEVVPGGVVFRSRYGRVNLTNLVNLGEQSNG